MIYTSMHTHTDFCDGADSVETMCRSAWESGFYSIGFSSHAPLPSSINALHTGWMLNIDKLEAYAQEVLNAKERWKDRIKVYLGLEIDYIRGYCGPADGRFDYLDLDYCIGSVHFLVPENGKDPFTVDGPPEEFEYGLKDVFCNDGEAMAEAYWDAVHGMIKAGGFDILGHIDLIKKHNVRRPFFNPDGPRYTRAWKKALTALNSSDCVVEVNTGALNRGSLTELYPSTAILKALIKDQIPLTITADAHEKQHLGGYYQKAEQTLREAGCTGLHIYSGIKTAPWNREPL